MDRLELGESGEGLAVLFLKKIGYEILARRWRSSFGEIDLICFDHSIGGGEIIFVEVKTRRSLDSGYPEDSVTPLKLRHLSASAECYLKEKQWENRPHRFDVVAITQITNQAPEIVHLKGV